MSSLSISVSGTAYLQKCVAAGKLPGQIPYDSGPTPTKLDPKTGKPSGAQALSLASKAVQAKILDALKLYDPRASLAGYNDGKSFFDGLGSTIDIIA